MEVTPTDVGLCILVSCLLFDSPSGTLLFPFTRDSL